MSNSIFFATFSLRSFVKIRRNCFTKSLGRTSLQRPPKSSFSLLPMKEVDNCTLPSFSLGRMKKMRLCPRFMAGIERFVQSCRYLLTIIVTIFSSHHHHIIISFLFSITIIYLLLLFGGTLLLLEMIIITITNRRADDYQ